MAQRSRVPEFGNWANGENISYTVYFDKARKGPNGPKMINPNDPQENPNVNLGSGSAAPAPASRSRAEKEQQPRAPGPAGGAVRTTNDQKTRREDGGGAKHYPNHNPNLPPRNDNLAGRSSNTRNQQPGGRGANYGDPPPRGASRWSGGSEHSFEKSPVHQSQVRAGSVSPSMDGKYSSRPSPVHRQARSGGTSPSMDGKYSYEKIHGTPGRSHQYQKPVFSPPERGSAPTIPKFGGWDEKNPASGDGYTGIFNKAREERRGTTPQRVPVESAYENEASKPVRGNSQGGCFPWCKSF